MQVRQSALKSFASCPLRYRYEHIDRLPREQSGALTFGSIMHECLQYLEETGDLDGAIKMFRKYWKDPQAHNPEWEIDYYVRGTDWRKYNLSGAKILRDWYSVFEWNTDLVLAREYQFTVPIGSKGNELTGTIDRLCLRYMPKINKQVVLISDFKSGRKAPTKEALAEDIQFSAYCYATTVRSFWDGLPNGSDLYDRLVGSRRWGEWIHLVDVHRIDAGERTERHYRRLEIAVDAMAASIEAEIFVPNISGETCVWCQWRRNCGLPELGGTKGNGRDTWN